MPRLVNRLTESKVKASKPDHADGKPRAHKLPDGNGLYLLVTEAGTKLWRLRYRRGNSETMLGLGEYPAVSLAMAREKRDDAERQIAKGIDPAAAKRAARGAQDDTFKSIAEEWLVKQPFTSKTLAKARWTFDDLLYPWLGNKPVKTITAPDVLSVLRRIESRGKHETAHRTKQRVGQVLRYAIQTGRAERDVTADLRGALTPLTVTNHAAITEPAKVGELLRAIDGYRGQPTTEAAMKLAPLVFVRPGELRAAEWAEFDLEGDEPTWRIPGERMKMGDPHVVPLSTQAVAVLRVVEQFTGEGKLVFPSLRGVDRPLSENAITAALRRMGYDGDTMTWHGFRSMASTLLNEQGWHPDLIELQLAHAERNKVRAAYNRAQRLAERRKMMQAWADYLDGLKKTPNVVAIRRETRSAAA
jgi:integrase